MKTVLALYCTLPWWCYMLLVATSPLPKVQVLNAYGATLMILSPMMIGFGVLLGYIIRRDFYKEPK